MQTRERLEEFRRTFKKEAIIHRRIARELIQEANDENDKLDDSRFHDGQVAMADKMKVEFEIKFAEELKR